MDNILAKKESFNSVIKGILVAVCVSIIGVFIFALLYKFVDVSVFVVRIINQIIKIISIIVGCSVAFKKDRTKGLLKGSLIGLFYTLLSFLAFSLLVSHFSLNITLLYDSIFAIIVGMICGIMMVNMKRKSY